MKACCPTCGSRYATWTPTNIVAALRAETERFGGNVPSSEDWRNATPEHPTLRTVYRHFKSWADLVSAAGLEPNRKAWTRADAERTLLVFKFNHGRLPTSHEWNVLANNDHPNRGQIRRLYGSWAAFIVACGYEPAYVRKTVESYRHQAGAAQRRLNFEEAAA